MKTTLMWTINDFLSYEMVSECSTCEKIAYPYYMKNNKVFTLMIGGKAFFFLFPLEVITKLSSIQK